MAIINTDPTRNVIFSIMYANENCSSHLEYEPHPPRVTSTPVMMKWYGDIRTAITVRSEKQAILVLFRYTSASLSVVCRQLWRSSLQINPGRNEQIYTEHAYDSRYPRCFVDIANISKSYAN